MRRKIRARHGVLPAGVACAFLLTGCLYSTHHFNSGRLLPAGNTSVTLGAGPDRTFEHGCAGPGYSYRYSDSTGSRCVTYREVWDPVLGNYKNLSDTSGLVQTWSSANKYSLGYRLGVADKWSVFTGAEIGIHLEAPTNPVSGEFDVKVGLPVPGGRPYHHSLSAGWIIGAWADNSYFMEYAVSRAFGRSDLFAGYRGTYLASQLSDLDDAQNERRFGTKRRFIHQADIGFKWALPAIPVVPDFIAPVAVLSYPLAPFGSDEIPDYLLDDHLWNFSVGMGWEFK